MAGVTVRFAFVLAAALVAAGCSASRDVYEFHSTQMEPKSVSLVEMPAGETVWSMDIPQGQKLWVQMVHHKYKPKVADEKDFPAGTMHWALHELPSHDGGQRQPVDEGTVALSGQPVKLDWDVYAPEHQPRARLRRSGGEADAEATDQAAPADEPEDAEMEESGEPAEAESGTNDAAGSAEPTEAESTEEPAEQQNGAPNVPQPQVGGDEVDQ
jgi:hypothetical protein